MLNLYRRVYVVAKRLAQPFNTRDKEMSERRLGVYAHPDDEFMTSYALTEEGVEAFVFMATDGRASSINNRRDAEFVRSGKRREEAEASLTNLKVPDDPEHRVYAGLPDGELARHREELVRSLAEMIVQQEIDTVVTTGADGFDKHDDHVTMFEAVVAAINAVRESDGRIVNHITLNSRGEGNLVIEPTAEMRHQKLQSMICNYSQHDVRELQAGEQTDDRIIDGEFAIGKKFDEEFADYWPLLRRETYDVVTQKASPQPEPVLAGQIS